MVLLCIYYETIHLFLWRDLLIFPVNASSITFPLWTLLLTTAQQKMNGTWTTNLVYQPGFYFYIAIWWSQLQDGYRTERMRWELCFTVGKVLILFIAEINNNSISPTKIAQFEGITLIKTLIKNISSQHPINYF